MSDKIDPESARPTTVQSFELSDRNPEVHSWGGEAEGGQIVSPPASEGRVTPGGPTVPADTGMKY